MRFLALLLFLPRLASADAHPATPIDTGVIQKGKAKVFHCAIPKDYGQKSPEALELKTDLEFPPPPPVEKPPVDLCLTDPAKFFEDQAGWMYTQSVLGAPETNAKIGTPNVTLSGTPEELRILERLLTSGEKEGKRSGLWPQAADACS